GRIDGSLTATSNGGNVGQSGGLAVGGTAGIDAGSGDIAFADTLSNDFRGTVSLTGGAVRIANSRALTLGAVDAASLSVITAGPITQAAGTRIDVTGAADFDASTTAITLTNDNDFGGAVSLRGGATHIHDRGDLTLGTVATSALSVEAGGDLNLGTGSTGHIVASSGGDITQSGMLSLGAAGRVSTLTAGASGRIALGTVGNTLSGLFSVTGGDVQLRSRAGLLLDNVNVNSLDIQANDGLSLGYGNIRGDLVARTSGVVIQAGGVTVEGTTLIDAGAGAITLSNAGNDFQGAVTLRGGTTTIHDANTLTLGTLDVAGLTAVSGGALNLGQGDIAGNLTAQASGGVSQSGALAVGGATTIAAGGNSIDLGRAGNAFGGLVSLAGSGATITSGGGLQFGTLAVGGLTATSNGELILGRGTVSGALSATSNGGRVAQSGALNVVGPAHIDAGSGAIELSNAGNIFSGAVSLTGGSAAIRSASGLTLGTLALSGDLVANSQGGLGLGEGRIDGALVAGSAGGAIGQASGGLTVAGSATIDAGAGNITLDAGNDFRGPVALTGGAVRVRDVDDLEIGALVGGTGGVDLQAGGNLLLAAGDIDTGGADLRLVAEGTLATPGALRGANVTLRGGTGLDLDHDVTATSGLSLDGGVGAIEQNAGRIAAARLDVEGGSARLDATGNAVAALGDLDVAGAFALRNTQAILQAAGASVEVGGAASFDASGQQIVLTNAGNDFGGPVSLTGGAVTIHNANALTLGTLDVTALDAASGGALGLGQGDIAGNLTANAGGAVSQSGALAVGGTTTIDARGNSIDLGDAGNAFGGMVSLSGGGAAIASAGRLQFGTLAVGGLTATSNGELILGRGIVSGTLSATSNGGRVAQSGALNVVGPAHIDAGSGAIELSNAGNIFSGAVSLTGGAATIQGASMLTLGTLALSGDLVANSQGTLNLGEGRIGGALVAGSAGGAIGQASGGLTVAGSATIDAGAGNITLDAGNDFRGPVALTGGAVRVRDVDDLEIGALVGGTGGVDLQAGGNLLLAAGDIDTGSADLRLVAGGTLATPGALRGANVTLRGGTGLDLGHDVTAASGLSLAGGAIQQSAGRIAAERLDVEGSSARLDAAGNAVGALGDVDVAGAFTLRNTQAIRQAAGTTVEVGGAASFDAGGQEIVLANAGNDFGGPVSLTGSD
ncbi:beta strand repeat-containing protein, partial [Coralloluteibacterium thermophilus]